MASVPDNAPEERGSIKGSLVDVIAIVTARGSVFSSRSCCGWACGCVLGGLVDSCRTRTVLAIVKGCFTHLGLGGFLVCLVGVLVWVWLGVLWCVCAVWLGGWGVWGVGFWGGGVLLPIVAFGLASGVFVCLFAVWFGGVGFGFCRVRPTPPHLGGGGGCGVGGRGSAAQCPRGGPAGRRGRGGGGGWGGGSNCRPQRSLRWTPWLQLKPGSTTR